MLFNEIDNFIEVYNNSVIELKLVDQIPTNEVGPKTLYEFNNTDQSRAFFVG